jgi:Uma2 family endonuclease
MGITTVTNPTVIIEVLSKSTKNYDRSDKFQYYRSISELQEYILIDQYSCHIEHFSKQAEGQWLFTEFEGKDRQLNLTSVEFNVSLNELYEGVDFNSTEES